MKGFGRPGDGLVGLRNMRRAAKENGMKVIERVADALLGAVVPTVSAGACCGDNGMKYQNFRCYGNGIGEVQTCQVTCNCGASCGGWVKYANPNCR
jgi:hypothetical protein